MIVSLLCLDFGNTRVKWGVRTDATWQGRGALILAELDTFEHSAAHSIKHIIACNVAGSAAREAGEKLARRLNARLFWVSAQPRQCGVTNGYVQPQQLGADRWAALIGAHAAYRGDCLVVMSGTATTIDVLTAQGEHRGGLILPGLKLMQQALHRSTADLPLAGGEFVVYPRTTTDAIQSGILQATLGAIERLRSAYKPQAAIVLSGGGAAYLLPQLAPPVLPIEYLVLEGLAQLQSGI